MFGKKRPEWGEIMKNRTGKKNPMYGRGGRNHPNSKAVTRDLGCGIQVRYVSVSEAAKAFGKHEKTIYRWIRSGKNGLQFAEAA